MNISDELAQKLSCDISSRPGDAAGISELQEHVSSVKRDDDGVTVSFHPCAENFVNSFVEAERLCCTTLSWTVRRDEHFVYLGVTGTKDQLEIVEHWFAEQQ
jgi:hypothetical protein